ncbi:ribonuclease HII [Actinobacteria bacterium YIM 96077]|uniref:Ribonuclease HII n=1 Tax=Phytoactinopolyspora halophila TaxID=1981511 RepID=A0A329QVY8_9ACTN|nr:ribonuclease HII [Phytoactinopolyspora halophila]AYY12731.1 ribonuclease HII [Actinobacteria bacterium YIM 96077]RAW16475.1 ribonuclease HII [Phytoactinopolyspora halophila]
MTVLVDRPRVLVRRDAGIYAYERVLARAGFAPVAGADEAGRGACAGPLVVAAAVLADGKRGRVPGLADSKLLTPASRERAYDEVVRRAAAWSVVVVEPSEIDRAGVHRCNVEAMRRALARLDVTPRYVLTDGFPVAGLGVPGLAMWKGDQVAACIAAASVIAKVTRDRLMCELHERWPGYGFNEHKGYVTSDHQAALERLGASPIHRQSYANVARVISVVGGDTVAHHADDDGEPSLIDGAQREGERGDER